MRRIIRIGAAFSAAMLAALLLLMATPAYAHNYLVDSTPLEGETLTVLPDEFSINTNSTLLDLVGDGGGFAIQIVDSNGGYYGDGCISIRDKSLSTFAALGDAGDYRMLWQLVSGDGHTISGEINFVWQPEPDQVLSDAVDAPPACGGGSLEENTAEGSEGGSDVTEGESSANVDAETAVLIGGAIALVLIAGVAIFLISVKRKQSEAEQTEA